MHLDPKCRNAKHICKKVCISQKCAIINPFVCLECGSHHEQQCTLIEYRDLISKLHKKQGMNKKQLFKYEQYVEDTFRILMKSLKAEFIKFREQYEHINASQQIAQFYQLLKSHKENIITGKKIYTMLHEQIALKNNYVLRTQSEMWSLSKELVQLQGKVNSKLPYYYTIYKHEEEDNTLNEVSLDQKDESMKDIEIKYKRFRDKLKGYFIENHLTQIQKLFDREIYNIQPLFRASKYDFSAQEFHRICDGKSNTLVIAKTEFDKLVGGFCAIPWRSPKNWQYEEDPSNKTFLFSLGRQLRNLKFQPFKKKFTIGMHQQYGPCFGDDLVIYNKSNTSKNCWSNFPDCYRCKNEDIPHSEYIIHEWVGVTDHYKKFNIVEWEVYKISFNKKDQLQRSFMEEYRKI